MDYYCEKCNHTGTITRNGKLYNCECFYMKLAKERMPPYVRNITYKPEHIRLGVIRHLDKFFYIKSTWDDMRAIIKILFVQHPNKFIKISSDAEIRDVYVGSKSKQSKTDDFSGEVFNNLRDLVEPPELFIVRLGEISNKNKAASGALYESIKFRIDYEKPLWLWTDINSPFGQGSYAYSEQVMDLIYSTHKTIEIPRILASDDYASLASSAPVMSSGPLTPVPVEETRERPRKNQERITQNVEDDEDIDEMLELYGKGNNTKKKFSK